MEMDPQDDQELEGPLVEGKVGRKAKRETSNQDALGPSRPRANDTLSGTL